MQTSALALSLVILVSVVSGCSSGPKASSETVGESCNLGPEPETNQVFLEPGGECGEGSCIGFGPDADVRLDGSMCTCHCAGPGEGPFCDCPSGFQCLELIEDLETPEAGSYCVPND